MSGEIVDRAPRRGGASNAVLALSGREVRRILRQPAFLAFLLLQPVLFIVLLNAVFGQVIVLPPGAGAYIDFLAPSMAVFAVAAASLPSAIGLCEDLDSGIMDRVRTAGSGQAAPLLARVVADVGRGAVTLVAVLVVSVAVGLDLAEPSAGLAVLGGGLLIGTAFSWLWLAIGLRVRSVDALQPIGNLITFVLLFLSASLSPVESFPGWLHPFVRANPLTTFAAALRDLAAGALITPAVGRLVVIVAAAWLLLGGLTVLQWRRLSRD